jgi:hypothetical protein
MNHLGEAKRVREYRLLSPPPLLNVMYCVRISLRTVKIYLAQHYVFSYGFVACLVILDLTSFYPLGESDIA